MRVIRLRGDGIFHVGGVSYQVGNHYLDYLHGRFLGLPTSAPFAERYRAALFGGRDAEQLALRARSTGRASNES